MNKQQLAQEQLTAAFSTIASLDFEDQKNLWWFADSYVQHRLQRLGEMTIHAHPLYRDAQCRQQLIHVASSTIDIMNKIGIAIEQLLESCEPIETKNNRLSALRAAIADAAIDRQRQLSYGTSMIYRN